jgi:uncharacterized protein (UPF0548 family)
VFCARRPTRQTIERFAEASRTLPLSYSEVGMAKASPAGYDVDETILTIGHGEAAFERAKAALAVWKHFDFNWVAMSPRAASIEPGTVVAVLIRHLGFWSLNGCRVVYGLGNRSVGPTFGFAYGTLSNHAERGEEIFDVSLRPDTFEVIYRIRAVSRPRAALARLGYPVVRMLQARFRRDSGEAMRRATRPSRAPGPAKDPRNDPHPAPERR